MTDNLTPHQKARQTIIDKYGSWEAYVKQRYLSPEKAEQRKQIASEAGKAKKSKYTFQNKEIASKAGKKRWQ